MSGFLCDYLTERLLFCNTLNFHLKFPAAIIQNDDMVCRFQAQYETDLV